MALTDLATFKEFLGRTDTAGDALLLRLLEATSVWLEAKCGRRFAAADYTDRFTGDGSNLRLLRCSPVIQVSSVTIDGQPVANSVNGQPGWYLDGAMMRLVGYLFTEGAQVSISYRAGYEFDIPADVVQAVLEMAALKYRERGHIGTSSQSLAGQSVSFLPSVTPIAVQSVIDTYRRWSI